MVDEALSQAFERIENRTPEDFAENEKNIKEKAERDEMVQLRHDIFQHIALKQEDYASEKAVDFLKEKYKIFSIKHDRSPEIYYYEDGQLKPNGESFLKEKVRDMLLHTFTTQRFNKIMVKMCADNGYDLEELHRRESENIDEIPVSNGILNIKTKVLSEFSKDKIFFNKINAGYNPKAKCPKIEKFLLDIVENKEDVDIIFEIIGSTLYKKYDIQTIVMFLGEGENGKGWLCSLIRTFLGNGNCQSLPLAQLNPDCYEVKDLRGSLANIAGDISNTALKDTGMLKELSSGTDKTTSKRKFMDSLGFVNYAKLIFACNELPRVYDFSHGFWRRWLLLQFPYLFLKKDEYKLRKNEPNVKLANPDLFQELITKEELSGLLNEALKGLDRLSENKQFSYTKSTAEVKNLWVRKSDSFTAFCFDNIESNLTGFVTKKSLAKEYNKFCKKHGVPGTSSQSMKRTLQELYGCLEDRKHIEFAQEWIWEGIKFKESKESNENTPIEKNKILHIGQNKLLLELKEDLPFTKEDEYNLRKDEYKK